MSYIIVIHHILMLSILKSNISLLFNDDFKSDGILKTFRFFLVFFYKVKNKVLRGFFNLYLVFQKLESMLKLCLFLL